MARIKLDDIQLSFDNGALTISSVHRPNQSVTLDANAVEELVDFVQTFSSRERPEAPDDNRRESFRVPIINPDDLKCVLTLHGETFETHPSNISMTGVYIKRRASDPFELTIGDELHLRLITPEQQIKLDAVVRRLGYHGYGLFFPCTVRNDVIDPPPEIRRMVMDLQRRWMATRSDFAR